MRRVPSKYAEHDRRVIVKMTTKVRVADDLRGLAAVKIAAKLNADLEAFWRGLFLAHGSKPKRASGHFNFVATPVESAVAPDT